MKKSEYYGNEWNMLVKIKHTHTDPKTKEMAGLLLNQLNTASGSVIVKKEARTFLSSITIK